MRMWGRTIHDQPGDIAEEVLKTYSNKPCFGVYNPNEIADFSSVEEQGFPIRRFISRECSLWSDDSYENNQSFYPAVCKSCKNILQQEEVSQHDDGTESADTSSQEKDVLLPKVALKVESDSYGNMGEIVKWGQKTCEVCGKTFSKTGNLKKHMLFHLNLRPFPCEVCGKTFRASNTLKQHMDVHNDLKTFRCSRCGRGFRQKQHLKAHERKMNKCSIESRDASLGEKDVLLHEVVLDVISDSSNYNLSDEDFAANPLENENAGTKSSRYCDLEDTSSCHQKEVESGEMTTVPGRTEGSPSAPGQRGQPPPVPPKSKRQGGKRKETCAVCGPTHQTRHRIPPTSEPARRAEWIR